MQPLSFRGERSAEPTRSLFLWSRSIGKKEPRMSVYEKLKALNITLPKIEAPAAAFVPFVRAGNLVFVSGHIAMTGGKPWTGKLGADLTTEQGRQAAGGIAIELI